MLYKEELPNNCPPHNAVDVSLESVCRFLPFPEGDERNFHSHFALGKPTGNAPECKAKSLSLFRTGGIPDILAAKKTAFFKKMKICLMSIPEGSGNSLESNSGNIDLWMIENYDPSSSIVSVVDSVEELDLVLENA